MHILLVNPNRMLPPVAPIGLDYVAASLSRRGYEPVLCDLTFADDAVGPWEATLTDAIGATAPSAVGVSIRNIDDAYFASQDFVLENTARMIKHIRTQTDRPVILGGVGFSSAPRIVLEYTGADYGIAGEGDPALADLLDCIAAKGDPAGVPGAVFCNAKGHIVSAPPRASDLGALPVPRRRFVDNVRYFAEGGQAGIETKRGCPGACIYCVDPVAKGSRTRVRTPDSVSDEFADLLGQGINVVHLCDCEFNLPVDHARAVCEALVRRGLASEVRWYTYACAKPFDDELARAMRAAGCAGVNFGVDHCDNAMLRRLGRSYTADDIRRTVQACRDAGLTVMCDMLLGGPGETPETLASAIDGMRAFGPDCIGLSCGVRVYPNTPIADMVRAQGPFESNPNLHGTTTDNADLLRPIYFIDSAVGPEIHARVTELVGGDKRFFHADPDQVEGNYNYNDNSVLMQAIRAGARGAYWDILRNASARARQ